MDKARLIFVSLCAVVLLGGCVTTGSLCTAGPIVLNSSDDVSRETGEQILIFNESGAEECGWERSR